MYYKRLLFYANCKKEVLCSYKRFNIKYIYRPGIVVMDNATTFFLHSHNTYYLIQVDSFRRRASAAGVGIFCINYPAFWTIND